MGGGDRLLGLDGTCGRCVSVRSIGKGVPARRAAGPPPRRTSRSRCDAGREVSAAPERVPDVGGEHPDVGAAAADDAEVDVVVVLTSRRARTPPRGSVAPRPSPPGPPARPRRASDRPPSPRCRRGAPASSPRQHRHGGGDLRVGCNHGRACHDVSVGVQRGGGLAEAQRALVGLGEVAEEAQQPRRATRRPSRAARSPSDPACRRGRPCACRARVAPRRRHRAT